MSESPRSDKCQTRYSTPAPELDDHRFQAESLPMADGMESFAGRQPVGQPSQPETERPNLLQVNDALREGAPVYLDFEQAIADDDDPSAQGARRLSLSPAAVRTPVQRPQPRSRNSSVSSKSSSPPNSVEAFAEPRRRERANTLESRIPSDLDLPLHRTVSTTSHHQRRPTFSNESAIRPDTMDPRVNPSEGGDVCFPPYEEPGKTAIIDYEELEEFVALKKKANPSAGPNRRKHSLSSQSRNLRVFHDLRPDTIKADVPQIVMSPSSAKDSTTESEDLTSKTLKDLNADTLNEKKIFNKLQNTNEPNRFSFFSSELDSTIHASELGDLVLPGDSFRDLFELGPEGGVWWLDLQNPTNEEIGAISRAFSIHPLTAEDIITQEAREKVELFKQYYFVCFRTFYQIDQTSEQFLEPVNLYMVVFREGVISFSFVENPHAANVRRRIGKLREYVSLSSDWICYAMM